MSTATVAEIRLTRMLDERATNQKLHDDLLKQIEDSDDKIASESQAEQVKMYRERAKEIDDEIVELEEQVKRQRDSVEASKRIRRQLAAGSDVVDIDGDEIVYRSFAAFARDVIMTRQSEVCSKIGAQVGKDLVVEAAERLSLLKRAANTLSSNVGGLNPPQHLAQIFQVIDNSRPIVAASTRATLERGSLTYPKVTQRPLVAVQANEKTEGGSRGMVVDLETANASTYLGGGDLSWQAINWSTPDALQLWFDLAAADYALKTEQDAADVLQVAGGTNTISSPIGATPTFADFMTAVGAGFAKVFTGSGRIADTIYMAPDRFGYLLGLTSAALPQFTQVGGSNVGPLNFVVSRGMDAGVIVVGDRQAMLVAETAGAPVELRVVEPAIGGVEVGIIGAFEAVAVDDDAFSLLTTAT